MSLTKQKRDLLKAQELLFKVTDTDLLIDAYRALEDRLIEDGVQLRDPANSRDEVLRFAVQTEGTEKLDALAKTIQGLCGESQHARPLQLVRAQALTELNRSVHDRAIELMREIGFRTLTSIEVMKLYEECVRFVSALDKSTENESVI